uniref:Uncharacterized protein n=1 Tax=Arundo donax TaxID=35708 RepID=A0A0A8Z2X0_ARUDO
MAHSAEATAGPLHSPLIQEKNRVKLIRDDESRELMSSILRVTTGTSVTSANASLFC